MASLRRILPTRSFGDAGATSSSSHRTLRVKNSQEITITDIYYKGSFKFRSDYAIKIDKQEDFVIDKNDSFQLFTQHQIDQHLDRKYNHLHIGLVQVAVKPLTRIGLPSSILLCGYDIDTGSQNLAIIYRVSYKVMNTVCPKAKDLDSKGETTLFQTNLEKSNVAV
ncbi:hypothetical protein L3X38_025549 [Prunus dulcis]|uniref:Uncharacterized protein n=1 Tax=Prunus dulcis TaxID=3755 RepID=A0AAD4W4F4_PRUDU|nr:hypothetical protein L3X38_025549 [Prunus dulcis]